MCRARTRHAARSFVPTLALVTLSAACGPRAPAADAPAVSDDPAERPAAARQPPGVVLEAVPARPVGESRASASAGVVALREPPDAREVERVVEALVHTLERGDDAGARALYARRGMQLGKGNTRQQFIERMIARLSNRQRPSGLPATHLGPLEIQSFDELGEGRPATMEPSDVWVRTALAVSQSGSGGSLAAPVLVLVLRREDGVLKIADALDDS